MWYKTRSSLKKLDRYVLHFLWVGDIIVNGQNHIFLIGDIINRKIYFFSLRRYKGGHDADRKKTKIIFAS